MNHLDAIKQRISVRSFTDTPIYREKLSKLMQIINSANKHDNLNIEFIENASSAFDSFFKSYGMFKGVRSIIAMKGYKSDINLKEKVGYNGEKLILEATSLGLGTCWVGVSFDRKNKIFQISRDEELVCVIPIGEISNQNTIITTIYNKIKHYKNLENFYTTDKIPPEWFIDGIKAVQLAPSARNTQKVRFTYSNNVTRISIPNDSPFDLVDLGIAKLHFELGANGEFKLGNNVEFKHN